jgi:hypothetical protein
LIDASGVQVHDFVLLEEAETQHVVHNHDGLMRCLISSVQVAGGNTTTVQLSNVESRNMPAERTSYQRKGMGDSRGFEQEGVEHQRRPSSTAGL